MTMPTEPFSLFSSLRYDPLLRTSPENTATSTDNPNPAPTTPPCPFYHLTYHRDRMLRAAHHFNWPVAATAALELTNLRKACEDAVGDIQEPLKLRTLLSPTGILTIEPAPVPPTTLRTLLPTDLPAPSDHAPTWRVHIDTIPTTPSGYTTHKTTSRDHYLSARSRTGIASFAAKEEVVLWNERGECMEGSLTSLYFWRAVAPVVEGSAGWRWVTPSLESGGNNGTTRRWLLERGMVTEGVIGVDGVRVGEVVLLSNGVRGIWAGVVVGRE